LKSIDELGLAEQAGALHDTNVRLEVRSGGAERCTALRGLSMEMLEAVLYRVSGREDQEG
jgi:hypothetical protein